MLRDTTNDQVPDIGFRQVTERNPFKSITFSWVQKTRTARRR